jgi:hypothetical protein
MDQQAQLNSDTPHPPRLSARGNGAGTKSFHKGRCPTKIALVLGLLVCLLGADSALAQYNQKQNKSDQQQINRTLDRENNRSRQSTTSNGENPRVYTGRDKNVDPPPITYAAPPKSAYERCLDRGILTSYECARKYGW